MVKAITEVDYDDELFRLDIELDEFIKLFRKKYNRDPLSFEIPDLVKFNEERRQYFEKVNKSKERFIANDKLPTFRVIVKQNHSDNEEVYIIKAANIQDACKIVQENAWSKPNDDEIKKVEHFPIQGFFA